MDKKLRVMLSNTAEQIALALRQAAEFRSQQLTAAARKDYIGLSVSVYRDAQADALADLARIVLEMLNDA